jgi:thiol-disulfide isomerase/thioredoxin
MSTKKILLFLTVLVLAACGRETARIKGRITENKGKMLYFEHVETSLTKTLDSVELKKSGRFSFSAPVRIPDFYQLRLGKSQIISLLLKKGETIRVSASGSDFDNTLELEGSFESENLNKLTRYLNETRLKLDSVSNLYQDATTDTLRNRLNREYNQILEDHRKYSMAYLLTHSQSLTCIYTLYQQISPGFYVFYKTTDLQFFKIISDTLTKYYPKSKHVTALRKNTQSMLSSYQAKILMRQADTIDPALPAIELEDVNGNLQSLSSLKGRYVLLSFWASWEQPCIEQNIGLKEIYKKYRKHNFEILQVSFDNSVESWRRAVRYDELPWLSVIDPTFPNSKIAASYNVQTIPANYLIDKDNLTILAKNLSPEELQSKLSELFN